MTSIALSAAAILIGGSAASAGIALRLCRLFGGAE